MLVLKQVYANASCIRHSVFKEGDEAAMIDAIEVHDPVVFKNVPEDHCHSARSLLAYCNGQKGEVLSL